MTLLAMMIMIMMMMMMMTKSHFLKRSSFAGERLKSCLSNLPNCQFIKLNCKGNSLSDIVGEPIFFKNDENDPHQVKKCNSTSSSSSESLSKPKISLYPRSPVPGGPMFLMPDIQVQDPEAVAKYEDALENGICLQVPSSIPRRRHSWICG